MIQGGAFLTSGADTCVYAPEVACAKQPKPPLPAGSYVSRITEKKGEAKDKRNQALVKGAIQRIKEKYSMDVSGSFNLATAVCTPKFKEADLVGGPCEADENNTTAPGKQKDKLNFITPKQDEDFKDSTEARNPIMVEKLRRLFRDVIFLNNEGIVHGDIHDGNVSWMGDHLVLHDWGRTYHGVKGMRKALKERYFDKTHLQELFDKCTIVLEGKPDDETLRRYMMFFDIVNMTYELLKNSTPKVQHADLDTFIGYLNTVWDSKVSGDELRVKILRGVHTLFPQGQAAPTAPPPAAPPKDDLRAGGGQTERFCSCVKKVKKTLKARPGSKDRSAAEGRAIAICTKSVLQTRGRTLRKVRCRDKVLETQPMKPQEGGGDDQTGGKLFAMGADTPVFNNEKVKDEEWNGFPVMLDPTPEKQKQFDNWITTYNPVVRMVSAGDGEIPIHRMLKGMLKDNVPPFNSPFVKMHINLWAGNGIYRIDPDETRSRVDKALQAGDDMRTKLDRIIGRFGRYKWYGLVTRTQQKDVRDLSGKPFIYALCAMLRVLLHIDGRIVHFDLHTRNMALMRDGTPVMHDVGRMKIRDVLAVFAPGEVGRPGKWNKRILRNVLMPIFEWPNYNMDYGQYFYIARFFRDLRVEGVAPFVKEVFPKPTEEDGWVQNDISPVNEDNKKAFEAWLNVSSGRDGDKLTPRQVHANWVNHDSQKDTMVYDANGNLVDNKTASGALFLDPPTETRYHQIARVFDILSVLKALSWDYEKGAVALEPVKTAMKIIGFLAASPPTATKANVNKTIRDYIELAGTRTAYGGNTPELEDAWAGKYLETVNDARSGKKKVPEVAAPDLAAFDAKDLATAFKARADASAASAAAEAKEVEVIPPQPDPLNDAFHYSEPERATAQRALDVVPIPEQLSRDLASEIVRESKNADKPDVLIEKQGMMSPKEVADEAKAVVPAFPEDVPSPIKMLSNEDKELAARVEDAMLAQGSSSPVRGAPVPPPPTGGSMEGGVFKDAGYTAITFEAHDASWNFLPKPTDPAVATPVVEAIAATHPPSTIVAYVSPDTEIVKRHDLVKAAGVGRITNTYLGHYPCTLTGMLDYKAWKREPARRLERQVNHFPVPPTLKQANPLDNANRAEKLECLLVLKFYKTIAELTKSRRKLEALFEILDGLVELEGRVVINDLHEGNMAVMPDGHAVTFDYDRTCTPEEFRAGVETILTNTIVYKDLPGYKHIVDLATDPERDAKIPKLDKISDILTVLVAVEASAENPSEVETCRKALWASTDKEDRRRAIGTLKTSVLPPEPRGPMLRPRPQPRGLNLPGGRRTPRRKGLPQLL